jgi:hypothetical protein
MTLTDEARPDPDDPALAGLVAEGLVGRQAPHALTAQGRRAVAAARKHATARLPSLVSYLRGGTDRQRLLTGEAAARARIDRTVRSLVRGFPDEEGSRSPAFRKRLRAALTSAYKEGRDPTVHGNKRRVRRVVDAELARVLDALVAIRGPADGDQRAALIRAACFRVSALRALPKEGGSSATAG